MKEVYYLILFNYNTVNKYRLIREKDDYNYIIIGIMSQ